MNGDRHVNLRTRFQARDFGEALDILDDFHVAAQGDGSQIIKLGLSSNPSRGNRVYGWIEFVDADEKARRKAARNAAREGNR